MDQRGRKGKSSCKRKKERVSQKKKNERGTNKLEKKRGGTGAYPKGEENVPKKRNGNKRNQKGKGTTREDSLFQVTVEKKQERGRK